MRDRLVQFLEAENLTKAQFADSINVARAAISHIFAGRNNPGYDFIVNTMKAYPTLNIEWLLSGKGNMYKENGSINKTPVENILFDSPVELPMPASDDSLTTQGTHRRIKKIMVLFEDNTYEEIY